MAAWCILFRMSDQRPKFLRNPTHMQYQSFKFHMLKSDLFTWLKEYDHFNDLAWLTNARNTSIYIKTCVFQETLTTCLIIIQHLHELYCVSFLLLKYNISTKWFINSLTNCNFEMLVVWAYVVSTAIRQALPQTIQFITRSTGEIWQMAR